MIHFPSKTTPGVAPYCVRLRCDISGMCQKVGFCCERSDSQALLREYLDQRDTNTPAGPNRG